MSRPLVRDGRHRLTITAVTASASDAADEVRPTTDRRLGRRRWA